MNAFSKILSGLALASASLYAAAAPISVTDTMTFTLPVTDTAPNSFTIDLTNDSSGYIAGAGSVTGAQLHLVLTDPQGSNEKFSIFLGSNTTAAFADININGSRTIDITLDSAALIDLSIDGKLLVTLTAELLGRNDPTANYVAISSTLDVNPVTGAASIPEPASLGLMGITLAGLVATRRRKQK